MVEDESNADMAAMLDAIQVFRQVDSEIQAQTVAILLYIAVKRKPVLMQELSDALGISQASVSRNVAVWSNLHWKQKPGHNLVESWENPENRRQKFVDLTQKGRLFIKMVERALS